MVEVEAKIPISKSEFQVLKKRLLKEAKPVENRISADTYYEKSKPVHIRIRQTEKTSTFTIKRRQTVSGIESNLEMEWGIKDIGKWRTLLRRLNLRPIIRKFKKSTIFRLEDFAIELNYVRHLGYFLEIEKTVDGGKDVRGTKNKLIRLFGKLGYTPEQFEARPYLELLENV